ncbi:MAG TPA: S8 family serine peptidase [Polyangia bacterium]|nr:S8 family serine peptidase [Polyangia bacterium]
MHPLVVVAERRAGGLLAKTRDGEVNMDESMGMSRSMSMGMRARWLLPLAAAASAGMAACAPAQPGEGQGDEGTQWSVSGAVVAAEAAYLVSFTTDAIPGNAEALVRAAGGSIAARYASAGALLARSSDAGFAARLRATAGIQAVGAARTVHSRIALPTASRLRGSARDREAAPRAGGDPLSPQQWDMDQIRAPQAHAVSLGKRSVLVGVLDSGIDASHPDLVGQVDEAASVSCVGGVPNPARSIWSNDVIGHGTHVAGIIAAARNGVGIVGVAPGVRLAAVKVAIDDLSDPNAGQVFADAVVCGIDWAVAHGFDLMNTSLTIDPTDPPDDDIFCTANPDRAAVIAIVRAAVQRAARRDITLISASGNNFLNLAALGDGCRVLPVQTPRAIGVSAVGPTRKLSFYSDYGLGAVDLTAPGGDQLVVANPFGQVISSMPETSLFYQAAAAWNGQVQDCSSGTCAFYAYIQGTSMAAPHVTGVAALAISRFGKLSPEALLVILGLTARPLTCPVGAYDPGMTGLPATCVGPPRFNSFYGFGEVDALSVVK